MLGACQQGGWLGSWNVVHRCAQAMPLRCVPPHPYFLKEVHQMVGLNKSPQIAAPPNTSPLCPAACCAARQPTTAAVAPEGGAAFNCCKLPVVHKSSCLRSWLTICWCSCGCHAGSTPATPPLHKHWSSLQPVAEVTATADPGSCLIRRHLLPCTCKPCFTPGGFPRPSPKGHQAQHTQ
jgi:hypothetical protein